MRSRQSCPVQIASNTIRTAIDAILVEHQCLVDKHDALKRERKSEHNEQKVLSERSHHSEPSPSPYPSHSIVEISPRLERPVVEFSDKSLRSRPETPFAQFATDSGSDQNGFDNKLYTHIASMHINGPHYSSNHSCLNSEGSKHTRATLTFNPLQQLAMTQGWLRRSETVTNSSRLNRLVKSPSFDIICAVVIVTNCFLLASATNYAATEGIGDISGMPKFYALTDYMFTAWFLIELLLRVACDGPRKFWARDNLDFSWNYFDTIVVVMNLFETMMVFTGGNLIGSNVTTLRMLRVMRVSRAVRVLRLIHVFKELRMMVLCVMKSFMTLVWAMVLLAITMFVFGILLTQNVTAAIYGDEGREFSQEDKDTLREFFGTLGETCYTLFCSVTGGIDWDDVSKLLFDVSWTNGVIFCFYIFFTVLAMLNIISGIFLDSAMRAAHDDKDECISEQLRAENSTIQQMHAIFNELTQGDAAEITIEEFDKHLTDPRLRAHLATLGLDAGEVQGLFRLLDMDGSGTVTAEEFLFGCMRVKGTAKALDVATLLYENKRMVERWNKFMSYVEKQFNERQSFERRFVDKLQSLRMLALSSIMENNDPNSTQYHL